MERCIFIIEVIDMLNNVEAENLIQHKLWFLVMAFELRLRKMYLMSLTQADQPFLPADYHKKL